MLNNFIVIEFSFRIKSSQNLGGFIFNGFKYYTT
jgi:hypothetical protein